MPPSKYDIRNIEDFAIFPPSSSFFFFLHLTFPSLPRNIVHRRILSFSPSPVPSPHRGFSISTERFRLSFIRAKFDRSSKTKTIRERLEDRVVLVIRIITYVYCDIYIYIHIFFPLVINLTTIGIYILSKYRILGCTFFSPARTAYREFLAVVSLLFYSIVVFSRDCACDRMD